MSGNWELFSATNSVGIGHCKELDCDNYDNGVYIIEGWKIVGRQYNYNAEQHCYNLLKMLIEIDKAQPTKKQLGKERIETFLIEEGTELYRSRQKS